jgi:hypothetical protein
VTKSLLYLSLALFILSGCASPTLPPTATTTPRPTLTSTPTLTPSPTLTLTSSPTPEPKAEDTEVGQATLATINELGLTGVEVSVRDGHVVCTDIATGKEVCLDGKFDIYWLVSNLPAEKLVKTNITPINGAWKDNSRQADAYLNSIVQSDKNRSMILEIFPDWQFSRNLLLHDFVEDGSYGWAWGEVFADAQSQGQYLGVPKGVDGLTLIPLMPISTFDLSGFWLPKEG